MNNKDNFRAWLIEQINKFESLRQQGLYTDVDHSSHEVYEEVLKKYDEFLEP